MQRKIKNIYFYIQLYIQFLFTWLLIVSWPIVTGWRPTYSCHPNSPSAGSPVLPGGSQRNSSWGLNSFAGQPPACACNSYACSHCPHCPSSCHNCHSCTTLCSPHHPLPCFSSLRPRRKCRLVFSSSLHCLCRKLGGREPLLRCPLKIQNWW